MEIIRRDLTKYTKLPITVTHIADRLLPDIFVETPHKGKVQIKLKDRHKSLLGGVSETEKTSDQVIWELHQLEAEAKEYLLEQWLLTKATTA